MSENEASWSSSDSDSGSEDVSDDYQAFVAAYSASPKLRKAYLVVPSFWALEKKIRGIGLVGSKALTISRGYVRSRFKNLGLASLCDLFWDG